jgi:prepilin-type N-terminal cleavage/methylation domain-containing protein
VSYPLYMSARRGFTLLELLVVIAILGLVTATVTTRIADTLAPAAMKQSISQLEFTDQGLRLRARHSGKHTALHFEIGAERLECDFGSETNGPRTIRALGRGVRITKYFSPTQEVTYGTVTINYDDHGSSQTFAIQLSGRREPGQWFLVVGLTGQLSEVSNEAAAREILQLLLPAGVHAG